MSSHSPPGPGQELIPELLQQRINERTRELTRRQQAGEVSGKPSALVMGGFHLSAASPDSIQAIIDALRTLGVQRVAPSHCTGDRAMDLFQSAYGPDFVISGCGRVLNLPFQREE